MTKYIFMMTNGKHWFDLAKNLYENKIAEPILWLGDDTHYDKAKLLYGDKVLKMQTYIHNPYLISNLNYEGEYSGFFLSENYIRAKDRCLKKMDRLDLYSSFSRLDREAYFHNLTISFLKKITEKPDFLLVAENPHSHAQYLVYEICLYLKVPVYKFNNWMPVPLIFLENISSGKRIEKPNNLAETNVDIKIDKSIEDFVNQIYLKREQNEFFYMKNQRLSNSISSRFKTFFGNDLKKSYSDIKHNIGMILKSRYNPINPFRLNFLIRSYVIFKRKKNLYNSMIKNQVDPDYSKKYVYFPLHFEPERTSNPDGGVFHDHFLALVKLREFLPPNIKIYVKEHPSQILMKIMSEKGSRGRSPLFYGLIKNIKNLEVVNTKENSVKLILNSVFVATLTGTVALEASILGKKTLTFGNTWYRGCPNTHQWSLELKCSQLIDDEIHNHTEIKSFLQMLKSKYSICGVQNGGQKRFFKDFFSTEFENQQSNELYFLMSNFIKNETYLN